MSNKKECKVVKYRAWSKKEWIYLARILPNATHEDVIRIMLVLQKAILPKTNATIRHLVSGQALWENITDAEYNKVNSIRIIWGLKKEKIQWSKEHEILVLRTGLRIWKHQANNLIINTLASGAEARKKWLHKLLEELNTHNVWTKINTPVPERLANMDNINTTLNAAEQAVFKRWCNIEQELVWKNKQTTIIQQWLNRNTHIPEQIGQKWIEAWTYPGLK